MSLETDASTVKNVVYSNSHNLTVGGNLIAELRDLLNFNFFKWKREHVMCDCNRVAHALAACWHKCAEVEDPVVESLPSCIRVMIADDCSAIE